MEQIQLTSIDRQELRKVLHSLRGRIAEIGAYLYGTRRDPRSADMKEMHTIALEATKDINGLIDKIGVVCERGE